MEKIQMTTPLVEMDGDECCGSRSRTSCSCPTST
jgi:hypothetical protein